MHFNALLFGFLFTGRAAVLSKHFTSISEREETLLTDLLHTRHLLAAQLNSASSLKRPFLSADC